jgi:hypothetical protein
MRDKDGVYMDPPCGTGFPAEGPANPVEDYIFEGGAGRTLMQDVPQTTNPPSCSY